MAEFDAAKNGPLMEQPWVIEEQLKFSKANRKQEMRQCTVCKERWPTAVNLDVQLDVKVNHCIELEEPLP